MSFDLAIGPSNDLVFAANRDLLGVGGNALIEQRIKTRLKISRGSWIFDEDGTLGSRLDMILSRTSDRGLAEAEMFVREALSDLEGISIGTVNFTANEKGDSISIVVGYQLSPSLDEAPFISVDEQIEEIVTIDV